MSSDNGPAAVSETDTNEVRFENLFGVSPEVAAVAGPRVRDLLKEFFLAQIYGAVEDLNQVRAELNVLIGQAQKAMGRHPMNLAETEALVQRVVYQGQKCREEAAHIWKAIDIAREHGFVALDEGDLLREIGTSRPQPSKASVTT